MQNSKTDFQISPNRQKTHEKTRLDDEFRKAELPNLEMEEEEYKVNENYY